MRTLSIRLMTLVLPLLLAGTAELRAEDKQEPTPIQQFCQAATFDRAGELKVLLKAHPDLLNARNDAGFSALHYAAMNNSTEAATFLIRQQANVNVGQAVYQGTPLQYAAGKGNAEVAVLLIKAGAQIDSTDTFGRTPLMWAAMQGQKEMVQLLLANDADVNAATKTQWTPLHYAQSRKQPRIAKILIAMGADEFAQNSQGKTPRQVIPVPQDE